MKKFLTLLSIGILSVITTITQATLLNDAISWGNQKGLTIYSNPTDFMAGNSIRRDEAAKFFVQFSKLIEKTTYTKTLSQCAFSDLDKARPDLKDIVVESCRLGIFQGNKGKFNPAGLMTNAEAITVLVRIIDDYQSEVGLSHRADNYYKKANELNLLENLDMNNKDAAARRGNMITSIYDASSIVTTINTTNINSNNTNIDNSNNSINNSNNSTTINNTYVDNSINTDNSNNSINIDNSTNNSNNSSNNNSNNTTNPNNSTNNSNNNSNDTTDPNNTTVIVEDKVRATVVKKDTRIVLATFTLKSDSANTVLRNFDFVLPGVTSSNVRVKVDGTIENVVFSNSKFIVDGMNYNIGDGVEVEISYTAELGTGDYTLKLGGVNGVNKNREYKRKVVEALVYIYNQTSNDDETKFTFSVDKSTSSDTLTGLELYVGATVVGTISGEFDNNDFVEVANDPDAVKYIDKIVYSVNGTTVTIEKSAYNDYFRVGTTYAKVARAK